MRRLFLLFVCLTSFSSISQINQEELKTLVKLIKMPSYQTPAKASETINTLMEVESGRFSVPRYPEIRYFWAKHYDELYYEDKHLLEYLFENNFDEEVHRYIYEVLFEQSEVFINFKFKSGKTPMDLIEEVYLEEIDLWDPETELEDIRDLFEDMYHVYDHTKNYLGAKTSDEIGSEEDEMQAYLAHWKQKNDELKGKIESETEKFKVYEVQMQDLQKQYYESRISKLADPDNANLKKHALAMSHTDARLDPLFQELNQTGEMTKVAGGFVSVIRAFMGGLFFDYRAKSERLLEECVETDPSNQQIYNDLIHSKIEILEDARTFDVDTLWMKRQELMNYGKDYLARFPKDANLQMNLALSLAVHGQKDLEFEYVYELMKHYRETFEDSKMARYLQWDANQHLNYKYTAASSRTMIEQSSIDNVVFMEANPSFSQIFFTQFKIESSQNEYIVDSTGTITFHRKPRKDKELFFKIQHVGYEPDGLIPVYRSIGDDITFGFIDRFGKWQTQVNTDALKGTVHEGVFLALTAFYNGTAAAYNGPSSDWNIVGFLNQSGNWDFIEPTNNYTWRGSTRWPKRLYGEQFAYPDISDPVERSKNKKLGGYHEFDRHGNIINYNAREISEAYRNEQWAKQDLEIERDMATYYLKDYPGYEFYNANDIFTAAEEEGYWTWAEVHFKDKHLIKHATLENGAYSYRGTSHGSLFLTSDERFLVETRSGLVVRAPFKESSGWSHKAISENLNYVVTELQYNKKYAIFKVTR